MASFSAAAAGRCSGWLGKQHWKRRESCGRYIGLLGQRPVSPARLTPRSTDHQRRLQSASGLRGPRGREALVRTGDNASHQQRLQLPRYRLRLLAFATTSANGKGRTPQISPELRRPVCAQTCRANLCLPISSCMSRKRTHHEATAPRQTGGLSSSPAVNRRDTATVADVVDFNDTGGCSPHLTHGPAAIRSPPSSPPSENRIPSRDFRQSGYTYVPRPSCAPDIRVEGFSVPTPAVCVSDRRCRVLFGMASIFLLFSNPPARGCGCFGATEGRLSPQFNFPVEYFPGEGTSPNERYISLSHGIETTCDRRHRAARCGARYRAGRSGLPPASVGPDLDRNGRLLPGRSQPRRYQKDSPLSRQRLGGDLQLTRCIRSVRPLER